MWKVYFNNSSRKQYFKLNAKIQSIVDLLAGELEVCGPIRGNWKNYSKLGKNEYHCHLHDGKPTYVACWRVITKTPNVIEVYYVGTREKAPY